jgi:L-2-hydroxyglutarate oxidase LhgO
MERAEVECVVVGAGVIGLAVARHLAAAGREVLILEAAQAIGTGISARNSEVIHAGLYYPPGSLKAQCCVRGRQLLYAYCAEHGVEHRRLGKLVVATSAAQIPALEALKRQAETNGVTDLAWMDGAQAGRLEPNLSCVAAFLSPDTGIVDAQGLMLSLRGAAEGHGAMLALNAPVAAAACVAGGFDVAVAGPSPMQVAARILVNAAGLGGPDLARRLDRLAPAHVPSQAFAKGNYFALAGKSPFMRLIYPLPEAAGLGVHVTLDLGGQARFGPDVEWVAAPEYAVDAARAAGFYPAIRTYYPALAEGALQPAYAGIRPKLSGPGEPAADFRIDGPERHGIAGLVNLFGIESPGLTASLAIAERVAEMLGGV